MIPPDILTALLVLAITLPPGWLMYRKLCPVKRERTEAGGEWD